MPGNKRPKKKGRNTDSVSQSVSIKKTNSLASSVKTGTSQSTRQTGSVQKPDVVKKNDTNVLAEVHLCCTILTFSGLIVILGQKFVSLKS